MIDLAGWGLVVLGFAGMVCLGGCASIAQPVSQTTKAAPVLTLETPIDQIAADPHGLAILERDLPGMMASPRYPFFSDMSLSQLVPLSGGHLTQKKLMRVKADLAALPSGQ